MDLALSSLNREIRTGSKELIGIQSKRRLIIVAALPIAEGTFREQNSFDESPDLRPLEQL